MSKLEYTSLQPVIEFQLPYMFASEKVLEQKVDIPKIIRELSTEKDHVGLNVKFPIMISRQQPHSNVRVLIKVRKFRNKKTGEIATKEEIIGIVKDQFCYEALADFHFESKIPQDNLINHLKTYLSSSGIQNPEEENFLNQLPYRNLGYSILPANFSKSHNNFITGHKILADNFEHVMTNQKEKKEDKTRFLAKFIHFDTPDIPIPDPFPEGIENKPEYIYLTKKFDQRPIWLKNVLLYEALNVVKFDSYHMFKKILSYLAYSFKDGPWKHAYVKFKVDPRADPNTYIYQVIDVGSSDTSVKNEALSQAYKRNEFETYDPHFVEPPTKQRQLYQLCDLQDQQITEILEKEHEAIELNDNIKCDKKNGWISGKTLKAILKFMKSKFKLA